MLTSFVDDRWSIAVVGAGPRGVGLLDRLAANAPGFATGPLTVHLSDPFPAGAGRVWRFAQSPLPRFFGPPEVDELLARPGRLDFTTDIWPLMAKDIARGHYHALFTGHPDRTRVDFAEFAACYAESEWGVGELGSLVDKAVPDPANRFDPAAIDRPLAGLVFDGPAALTRYLCEYVEADLDRRANAGFSADLGAFLALLSVFGQLARLVSAGKLDSSSQVDDVDGFTHVPHITPGGLDAFAETVVPIPQDGGVFRTEYTGGALRSHLGL